MKILKYMALGLCLGMFMVSCSEDDLSDTSVLTKSTEQPTAFDNWITENFTNPYNIKILYKYVDRENDQTFHLTPAKEENSFELAQLVRYMWIDTYTELMGTPEFMAKYCPKLLDFIGSPAIDPDQGTEKLGEAESGVKITFYKVNYIDPQKLSIPSAYEEQYDNLNQYFFHTMHHEFCHILHQTISYPVEFNSITPDYTAGSWVNVSDEEALKRGFITPYASTATQEDFVELYSNFITMTPAEWESALTTAEPSFMDMYNYPDIKGNGREEIEAKFTILQKYLIDNWGIDIYKLRDIVQRRAEGLKTLNILTLDDLEK